MTEGDVAPARAKGPWRRLPLHWQVLVLMVAGALVGLVFQVTLEAAPFAGVTVVDDPQGVKVAAVHKASKAALTPGTVLIGLVEDRGRTTERVVPLAGADDFAGVVARSSNGDILWFRTDGEKDLSVPIDMDPSSVRARAVAPFAFFADIFLALLKMLIVPLVFASIVQGVSGLAGVGELGRLGAKTFVYYTASSLVAILVGQVLVNLVRPGDGAELGLPPVTEGGVAPDASFIDVLKRMVPTNIFESLSDNGAMLQIIFFALVFGVCLTVTKPPHGPRIRDVFESFLEVMMTMAVGVLKLIPYGVFVLIVKVVATTGVGIFKPLAVYMVTVVVALFLHAGVVLPLVLKLLAGVSPRRWLAAMSPALLTAFSTSSSSMTLPVTMESVERRGLISKKIGSFTLPLGATINMDGTALYECVGVIFLAQYYASLGGFELTLSGQALVVFMALLASVGAAGIPSAGLVMMLTILAALGLPLEGAALLLAVDRPLDMLRTTVNVWSDTVAAAVVARSEGEKALDGA